MKSATDSQTQNRAVFFTLRHYLLLGLMLFLLGGLAGRAFYLQIIDQEFLADQGQQRQIRIIETPAYRGAILDRHGSPLAISTPVDSVWVNPGEILQNLPGLETVTGKLGLDYLSTLATIQKKSDKAFVYLQRQLQPAVAQAVTEGVDGVYLQREYQRYYPEGEVVSHLVGFTDIDDNGQEGLELVYEDWLRAQVGQRRIMRNRKGEVIEELGQVKAARSGRDIVTGIDMRLQYVAYRSLVRAVQYHRAKSGSAVLIDVGTGEVLAMVNQPSYNPNQRKRMTASQQRNRALTDVFEPGSVIKPFTLAAAIDRGRFDNESLIDTAPGWIMVSGSPIKDNRNYGQLNLAGILRKSSNVGASRIAMSLSADELWQAFSNYGFGASSGVVFPAESSGHLQHHREWQPLDHAAIGYGYGVSLSVTQLARAYAMIANQGREFEISLLKKEPEEVSENKISRHVMKASTARMVMAMMEKVVGPEGTAAKAAITGYRIAGKTGTAKKNSVGGYQQDDYIAVFAGIAPVSDPRLVMVAMINEPTQHGYYGGTVAAPVFHEVMSAALRILNIPPDDPMALQAKLADTGQRI